MRWILITYTLFLSIIGIGGFLITPSHLNWLGVFSAKVSFLAFGIYGLFFTYKLIEMWD